MYLLVGRDAGAGAAAMSLASTSPSPPIWTSGPILAAVQSAHIFADCKDFVDSPLLVSPAEAWSSWEGLARPLTNEALRRYVNGTFGPPGGELVAWRPPDHQTAPPLLARLPAGPVRDWASGLNGLWEQLGRKVSPATLAAPDRTTLLPVTRGFVVPGGRFRESYCARSVQHFF